MKQLLSKINVNSHPSLYNEHLPSHNTHKHPCFPAFTAVLFLSLSPVSILLRSSIVIILLPQRYNRPRSGSPRTLNEALLRSEDFAHVVPAHRWLLAHPLVYVHSSRGFNFLLHQRCGKLPHNSVWKGSAAAAQNRVVCTQARVSI